MGADLGLFLERGSNDVIQVPELETGEFVAMEEYIPRVSEQDDVKGWLTERKYRVPVYIVTGVKIARGASVSLERTREVDARVGVSGPESSNWSLDSPRIQQNRFPSQPTHRKPRFLHFLLIFQLPES